MSKGSEAKPGSGSATIAHFESFAPGRPGWGATFDSPQAVFVARRVDEVIPILREVERASRHSWVAIAVAFDAAPAFDSALAVNDRANFPLVWAAVFDSVSPPPPNGDEPFALAPWIPDTSRDEYESAISKIRNRIERGDTYQINFTFPLRSKLTGDPWSCYRTLARVQNAGYSAYLDLGSHKVLSFSPELFVERRGDSLTTRPMKGTGNRGRWCEEDERMADALRLSEKDRAENVMIVDLLRSDLSRVAVTGSVCVPELFAVEAFGPVLQMSSTVTARIRPGAGLVDVLTALFPCGSVTGAPKVSSMSIIKGIEGWPRGLYTGAIGYIRPDGDFTLSVAIRTVIVESGTGRAEFGVGGGITWDSTAAGEYEETKLKARFLSETPEKFDLLETLALIDGKYALLPRHLGRAEGSARFFGFHWHSDAVMDELDSVAASRDSGAWLVRLIVNRDGVPRATASPLPATGDVRLVKLALSPVSRADCMLYHKTTARNLYDRELLLCRPCDDVIFWNEAGEVTESAIANIVVELEGKLYTPPRTCGLLAGTFRDELLASGTLEERVISKTELARAGRFKLVNSVRGWMNATLVAAEA